MRSIGKSDYGALVEYLADRQDKYERLGYVSVTNCRSEVWQAAIAEVLNTQAQNRRSTADKTYHLIVSFRADDQPDEATLKAIETRICHGLGYGEHQRVCVVHHDTDNLHFHIAINKIHPTRYTIRDPYNDHWTLGILCKRLEQEYNLEADNHQAGKTGSENHADDMEHHAGVQSLLGWIKRECADQIKEARSWAELHTILGYNGLELRERGNGLVITNGTGLGVKASSVARELSKTRLEGRLGVFQAAAQLGTLKVGAGRRYEARPMASRFDTVELYARYQNEQRSGSALRTAEWAKAAKRKESLIESIRQKAQLKRCVIKAFKGRAGKKILYGAISSVMKEEIHKINKNYLAERLAIQDRYQQRAWTDWLRMKATEGDQEALAALRARGAALDLKGDTVMGQGQARRITPGLATQDSITKKGTIIYRVGSTAVRDDGDKLKVSRGADREGLQIALRLAMERYGNRITVNGSAGFKEQIAQVAAMAKLPVCFSDTVLERRRQELLTVQGKTNEKPGIIRPGIARGQTDSRDAGRAGLAATGVHTTRTGGAGKSRFPSPGSTFIPHSGFPGKPDIGGIGRKPPPQGRNRLRELSELGVVQFSHGGQVLLPGDVPHHLEQPGAQTHHGVRRDIPGAGRVIAGQLAADNYIAEWEAMRLKVADIPKHTRFNPEKGGAVAFAGVRRVGEETLALLKSGEEIMVLPVDATAARRLKHTALGDTIAVTAKGSIKTRGRSR
jgi:hypothetical protein